MDDALIATAKGIFEAFWGKQLRHIYAPWTA
jgi:hypothetical protein